MRKILMLSLYVSLFILANLLVGIFGPWITPINALVIIGADMVIRDRIQYENGFSWAIFCCLLAGIITFLINPETQMIAVASFVSILLAGISSALVFKLKNGNFYSKSYPANVICAAIDSLVFPYVAFGSIMFDISLMQFIAKVVGATLVLYIMRKFCK